MKKSRDQLIELIASEEARLTRLDAERQTLNNQLYDLRGQLLAIDSATSLGKEPSALSPAAKIALFRSLFRGREDVCPKLWISKSRL